MKIALITGFLAVLSVTCSAAHLDLTKQVFPKSKPPAKTLYHIDLRQAPLDLRFAMTVLQGLVNRAEPRLYVSQNPEWHGDMCFGLWMDDLKRRGHTFEAISPEDALVRFRSTVKGAVLYESDLEKTPESLHKINALTLYCAVEDCLPVTEELNAKLKLPILLDTRGEYNTAAEAYEWAYRELWPRANHRIIAHTCPTHMVLRDYLVQHKAMPIWISKGTPMEADNAAQRFIREADPNAAVMGCWGGYGEVPAGRYSEPDLQRLCSEYGKFLVVSDGCFNTSVFSGLTYKRPEMKRPAPVKLESDKVYIVFHITDGDNLQWLQQAFVTDQWWANSGRGKVPISWSLNPCAIDLIPNFVEYVQSTATENDEFTCSTAGIGLVTPALYGTELKVDRHRLYAEYLRATSAAMARVGETCIHLGDTSSVPWTRADFDLCAREMPAVKGILGDYGKMLGVFPDNADYMVARNVVVLRAGGGIGQCKDDGERANKIADQVRAHTPPTRPGFMHVCLVNWFVTPNSIAKAMDLLGGGHKAVLPSQAVDLYHQAHQR